MKTRTEIFAWAARRGISPEEAEDRFEAADEDRLVRRLEPIVDRLEDGLLAADTAALVEVDRIAETARLGGPDARQARADAALLLEGWLEPGRFIVRTIARHRRRGMCPNLAETNAPAQALCA